MGARGIILRWGEGGSGFCACDTSLSPCIRECRLTAPPPTLDHYHARTPCSLTATLPECTLALPHRLPSPIPIPYLLFPTPAPPHFLSPTPSPVWLLCSLTHASPPWLLPFLLFPMQPHLCTDSPLKTPPPAHPVPAVCLHTLPCPTPLRPAPHLPRDTLPG